MSALTSSKHHTSSVVGRYPSNRRCLPCIEDPVHVPSHIKKVLHPPSILHSFPPSIITFSRVCMNFSYSSTFLAESGAQSLMITKASMSIAVHPRFITPRSLIHCKVKMETKNAVDPPLQTKSRIREKNYPHPTKLSPPRDCPPR